MMAGTALNFTRSARAEGPKTTDQSAAPLPRSAFTVAEVAATVLPLTEWTIRRLIRDGHLKARWTGRQYLITPVAIDDYLAAT